MMYIPDEEVRDVIEKLDNAKGSRFVLDRLVHLLHSNQESPKELEQAALIKNISNENRALTAGLKPYI